MHQFNFGQLFQVNANVREEGEVLPGVPDSEETNRCPVCNIQGNPNYLGPFGPSDSSDSFYFPSLPILRRHSLWTVPYVFKYQGKVFIFRDSSPMIHRPPAPPHEAFYGQYSLLGPFLTFSK